MYQRLLELHVRDEEIRELNLKELIPTERGGGTWAKTFLDGSLADVAWVPCHWDMYSTQRFEGFGEGRFLRLPAVGQARKGVSL